MAAQERPVWSDVKTTADDSGLQYMELNLGDGRTFRIEWFAQPPLPENFSVFCNNVYVGSTRIRNYAQTLAHLYLQHGDALSNDLRYNFDETMRIDAADLKPFPRQHEGEAFDRDTYIVNRRQ